VDVGFERRIVVRQRRNFEWHLSSFLSSTWRGYRVRICSRTVSDKRIFVSTFAFNRSGPLRETWATYQRAKWLGARLGWPRGPGRGSDGIAAEHAPPARLPHGPSPRRRVPAHVGRVLPVGERRAGATRRDGSQPSNRC